MEYNRYIMISRGRAIPFEAKYSKNNVEKQLERACWKAFNEGSWNQYFEFYTHEFYVYDFMNNHDNAKGERVPIYYPPQMFTLDNWFYSFKERR